MATKEVYFNEYCKLCKHYSKSEAEDPCYDCLDQGWNEDSHKPIKFEENEKHEKKRNETRTSKN